MIPNYYYCDGYQHCQFEDDEMECKHTCDESSDFANFTSLCFECSPDISISMTLVNNGVADCWNNKDEVFNSTIFNTTTMNSDVPSNEMCIYDRNSNSESVSHCLFYECPYHFKCPNTYCVHHRYECDSVYDCPNGDDEHQSFCSNHTCYHMFKCVYASHCLHPNKVCDGFKDCYDSTFLGEDENVCYTVCVDGCFCHGHVFSCIHMKLNMIPLSDDKMMVLLFKENCLRLNDETFLHKRSLWILDLSFNKISHLPTMSLLKLFYLYKLDLSFNFINKLVPFHFKGVKNLKILLLQGNRMEKLEARIFSGAKNLSVLNVAHQEIHTISECVLSQMPYLNLVNISNNTLNYLPKNLICNRFTKNVVIDLTSNPLEKVRISSMVHLQTEATFVFSAGRFCCLSMQRCKLHLNTKTNDCSKILHSMIARILMWIIGVCTTSINIFVALWKCKKQNRNAPSLVGQSLAISDGLTGVYLLIIVSADHIFGDDYIFYPERWLTNNGCKIAGVLSISSLELSACFMLTMTISLLLITKQETQGPSDNAKQVSVALFTIWLIVCCGMIITAQYSQRKWAPND